MRNMMKRLNLNNKGMTAIEILITFVLVVIIIISMYNTVLNYRNRQQLESYRESVLTYKNLLTKQIQDDLIKVGLTGANISYDERTYTTKVVIYLKDGTVKELLIKQQMAYDLDDADAAVNSGSDKDDSFMISYGAQGNATNYPLPDLGYSENVNNKKVYDFRINNLDINTNNNILTIYIGFYHHDLGKKYAINIVCPINYE